MSVTTLCGSLSLHPVSLGAAMHRAGYAALGLDWTYVPFKVTDLAGALAGMRALGIRGFGVSMPYKLDIVPLLDALDPHAARLGAVNTVVNDAGRLTGWNTDAVGALRALEEVVPARGLRVAVLGAGGAARAVAQGLCGAGARVTLANRTPARAAELASALRQHHGPEAAVALEAPAFTDLSAYDAVVNASSAGMEGYGEASPVPAEQLRPGLVVMDIVYKPIRTALVVAAEMAGASAIHGGRMLLHQAARQFELYTGRDAPLAAMDAALRQSLTAT